MKNIKLFNNRFLFFIVLTFALVVVGRVFYVYTTTKLQQNQNVKNEASLMTDFALSHREYYINLYEKGTIELNEKTLPGHPVFSTKHITDKFSNNNNFGVVIRTVSEQARNPKNIVDEDELKAVKFFRENKEQKEYFTFDNDEYFQYARPLWVKEKCLKCHGKKEEAPDFIKNRYTNSYNYKIGELRGVVSVKIPKAAQEELGMKRFYTFIWYDIFILAVVLGLIYSIFLRAKKINKVLADSIKEKSSEITVQNLFLSSYIQALDKTTALIKTDPAGTIIYANDKFLKDTGFTRNEVIGNNPKIIRHPDTKPETIKDMWETITSKRTWSGIVKGLRKDKTVFISKMSIVPVLDEDGDIVEYIAPRTDITELVNSKDKLQYMLITDRLTSFPNRQRLISDIKETMGSVHLALINIDRFKDVNDFYGHETADKLLIEIAQYFQKYYINGTIYKLPSDEYAILSEQNISSEEFYKMISSMLKKVGETRFTVNGNNIFLSFSCGIASNEEALMVKADMALQIAKEDKKHIIVYSESLDISKKITKNIEGVALLKEAIEHDTIIPHFQPIYNIKTKNIEKYEVLARIIKKNGYVIAPIKFLDIAMRSKLYPYITKSIISKSFEFFKDKPYEFSINISYEDIKNPKTVDFILEKLQYFNSPQRVAFEVLESDKVEDYELFKQFITKVKEYGCKLAIDDFGSGYSNFANLYELNIDYLKIDSSLVKYIKNDENSRKIVQTIINFAKDMSLETIAEFVEDKESLELLESMGIDYIQGYYIGKPQDCLREEDDQR